MAGIAQIIIRPLLLLLLWAALIRTGLTGEDKLISSGSGYDIKYPCDQDLICLHIWQFHKLDRIAVVSNGQIQTRQSKGEDSDCAMQIKDLTAEDNGSFRCRDPHGPSSMSHLNLMPGQAVSLQCVLLSLLETGHCSTAPRQLVRLMWVNEAGEQIRGDSQHRIKQQFYCDVTLTVTNQTLGDKRFRCQATIKREVQSSVEFLIRVPGLKMSGPGIVIETDTECQGDACGKQEAIGAAVGAAACVALTAVVALLLIKRRRAMRRLPGGSHCTFTANTDTNANDVIYADIRLPAGSEGVPVQQDGFTEYACIRQTPAVVQNTQELH